MGTRRGTNLPRMGDFNQSVILEAVRHAVDGLSRIELAQVTGLSAQTVTNITRRLLDEGLIREAGRTISGPGKPRVMLRLVEESRFAVGVHLDPAVTTFVLLDLAGEVVRRSSMATPAEAPSLILADLAAQIEELVEGSGVPRERIAGVGVAAPGPLDATRGTVIDPPKLPGWHRVALQDELAAAIALPVVLEKDTTAAAVGELWTRRGPSDDSFVFLYLGTGLGAAVVRDGEAVRGSTRNLGEIGHIVVDPEGPRCACGSRGCVDVVCTPEAIVERAEQLGVLAGGRRPGDRAALDASLTELCVRAAAGEASAGAVVQRAAEHLATLTLVLTDLLDVDRVVFGGPFWRRLADLSLPEVAARLARSSATRAVRALPVQSTVVGDDVGAVGAACVVLDSMLTPRTSDLLLGR
ncbi:ROK family protein [Microbacterium sp. NPDC059771]|uniref:ROK family transcriptional regulator n=1 Tax=Microbacterium sp. NPDC059771 TaxID=3346941 RepID=UPI0036470521